MKNCCFALVALSVFAAASSSANAQRAIEPNDENPVTRAEVDELLEQPWPDLQFEPEVSLAEVLEALVESIAKQSGTPVSIWPDKLELELNSVTSLEDTRLQFMNIRPGSMTIKQGLRYCFDQTDPRLGYVIGPGHLLITTAAKKADTFKTRIYDLSPFLLHDASAQKSVASKTSRSTAIPVKHFRAKRPGNQIESKADSTTKKSERTKRGRRNGKQRSTAQRIADKNESIDNSSLLQLIKTQLSPFCQWRDIDGQGGTISMHGQYAFVLQTDRGHENIEALLANLQKAIDERGPLKQTNFDRFREAKQSN